MNKRRKFNQLIIIITLPLVMWLFFSQLAFWHYHILDNGIVIEHAHPFRSHTLPDTPYQNHQHSDFEHLILAQLSNIITLLIFAIALSFLYEQIRKTLNGRIINPLVPSEYISQTRMRGPPSVC